MEIRNEEQAREMLQQWREMPLAARKRQIRLAIEQLELSSMYYEQKGNDKGVRRTEQCILILTDYCNTLG